MRNQVKKEAKSIVEDAYDRKNLPANHRVSAAQFLLKYNAQGKHTIPNFVFDNIDLRWTDGDVDIKVRCLYDYMRAVPYDSAHRRAQSIASDLSCIERSTC